MRGNDDRDKEKERGNRYGENDGVLARGAARCLSNGAITSGCINPEGHSSEHQQTLIIV